MRFAVAVVIAAAVQVVPYLRPDVPTVLAIAYVLFAALGAGFFAGARGWLAGALSVVLGAGLYGLWSRAALGAERGLVLGDLLRSETALLVAIVPYAVLGALAGALGATIRRRALAASP